MFELADDAFELGIVIAENCNPFKWLFGGPEIEKIIEAVDDFMADARALAELSYLCDHIDDYMQLSIEIAQKFADNADQIAAMNNLVNQFNNVTDTDQLLKLGHSSLYQHLKYWLSVSV